MMWWFWEFIRSAILTGWNFIDFRIYGIMPSASGACHLYEPIHGSLYPQTAVLNITQPLATLYYLRQWCFERDAFGLTERNGAVMQSRGKQIIENRVTEDLVAKGTA
jgi:isocitrate/isopropylmalate dehydrogenase